MNSSNIVQPEEENQEENNMFHNGQSSGKTKITPESYPAKIPLRTWIFGLSAPLLLICLCGVLIVFLMKLVNNQSGVEFLASAFKGNNNSDSSQEYSSQSLSVGFLVREEAMDMISNMDGTILSLEDSSKEKYPFDDYFTMGKTRIHSITLKNSTFASYSVQWCGRNLQIVRENLAEMDITMKVNDMPMRLNSVAALRVLNRDKNTVCQIVEIVLHDWSEGDHILQTQLKLKNKVNNGFQDFYPGENTAIYKVKVLSAKEAPLKSPTKN